MTSVVHVASPGTFGGLETVVKLLASNQRQAGYAVRVVLLGIAKASGHPLADALTRAGVPVEFVERSRFPYRGERAAVESTCRRVGAAILHTHGSRPDIVAGPVGRSLGIPAVSTVHGITVQGLKSRVMHIAEWRALRKFDAVIAVSRPLLVDLAAKGIAENRLVLIPNAFASSVPMLTRCDARRALSISDERFVIGWVGRLSYEKGADVLIDSLARLSDPRPTLVFVGDGPERLRLQRQASELGVASNVRWLGAVASAAELFPGFDGFVLSSRSEGTPMCLFEAIAAGTPAIVTAVGGVPDVVSPEEALLVRAEAPGDLARAIEALINDPEAARTRARAARKRLASVHGMESWIDRHTELYDSLIVSRARASE